MLVPYSTCVVAGTFVDHEIVQFVSVMDEVDISDNTGAVLSVSLVDLVVDRGNISKTKTNIAIQTAAARIPSMINWAELVFLEAGF